VRIDPSSRAITIMTIQNAVDTQVAPFAHMHGVVNAEPDITALPLIIPDIGAERNAKL